MKLIGWTLLPEKTEVLLGSVSGDKVTVQKRLNGLEAAIYLSEHQSEVDDFMRMERGGSSPRHDPETKMS